MFGDVSNFYKPHIDLRLYSQHWGFIPVLRGGAYLMPEYFRQKYAGEPVELPSGEVYIPYTHPGTGERLYWREGVGDPAVLNETDFKIRKAILEKAIAEGTLPFGDTQPLPLNLSTGYVAIGPIGEVWQPVRQGDTITAFTNLASGLTLSAPTFYSYARGLSNLLRGNMPLTGTVFTVDETHPYVVAARDASRNTYARRNIAVTGVKQIGDYWPWYIDGWVVYRNSKTPHVATSVTQIVPNYYELAKEILQKQKPQPINIAPVNFSQSQNQPPQSQPQSQPSQSQWQLGGQFSGAGLSGSKRGEVAPITGSAIERSSPQLPPINQPIAVSNPPANPSGNPYGATPSALSIFLNSGLRSLGGLGQIMTGASAQDTVSRRNRMTELLADWFSKRINWL